MFIFNSPALIFTFNNQLLKYTPNNIPLKMKYLSTNVSMVMSNKYTKSSLVHSTNNLPSFKMYIVSLTSSNNKSSFKNKFLTKLNTFVNNKLSYNVTLTHNQM